MDQKSTMLNVMSGLDGDNVQARLQELTQLRYSFSTLNTRIIELESQSKSVPNIRARRYRTEKHFVARTVARVKTVELNLARNEQLTLTDSTKADAWQLFTDTGQNITLPAVTIALPPPNMDAQDAIADLQSGYKSMDNEWDSAKANCSYYIAAQRFNETANMILQWDALPPINTRSSALTNLDSAHTEAGKCVDDSKNQYIRLEYDSMADKIEQCRAHIDYLGQAELAEQEAAKERLRKKQLEEELARKMKGLQSYLSELQIKLDQARDQILNRVSIAIQFEAPQSAAQDAQKCINDLESVRAGANRLFGELAELETYKPAPPGILETKANLKILSDHVNDFQSLAQLYIRKVQKVQIVIGQVQATENIISRLEEKINQQLAQRSHNSEGLELQLRLLKNSSFEIGAQDPLMQTLTDAAKEAKALGVNVADQSNRPDPDDYIYCMTVKQLQERLDLLRNRLKEEMDRLEGEIPIIKAQEAASERALRTLQDTDRLNKELEHIRLNGDKELRREHPEPFDVKSSLSRCDDLEKRLSGIESPVNIALTEIAEQLNDSNLTDGKLRDQLETASNRLQNAQRLADEVVDNIQAKMSDLHTAIDALAATAAILHHYQDALSMNTVCTTIDDFEHKQAILTELVNEIPINDPKFSGLKSLLTGFPENDLDRSRLTGIINEQNQEWNQLKWQLNMAIESNRKELERKQREKDKSDQMDELRMDLNGFLDKINSISTNQCTILGMRHVLEVHIFYDALQEQQKVLDQFNQSIEPEYKELVGRCRQFNMISEETELKSAWERVWFLTKNLIDKLKASRTFADRVEQANQVIAKWTIEAERFERESESSDVEFLQSLAREAQRAYAATQEDDQTIFVLPQFASTIASTHAPVARQARDEDGITANALSDELLKQWQNLKQRIQAAGKAAMANAKQLQIQAQSEAAVSETREASNLLTRLQSLQQEVNRRISTPTPLETAYLDQFLAENDQLNTKLRNFKIDMDKFNNRAMDFMRKSRDISQELQNALRSELEAITDGWNQIDSIWSVYMDKLGRIRNCCEKYTITRRQLENAEESLLSIDIVTKTAEERDMKLTQLRNLQAQFPQIEPLFFALESSHSECKGAEHRLQQKGFTDQGFVDLTKLIQDLIGRWRRTKNEIIRRQTDIKDCYERVCRFKKGVDSHSSFLDRKEGELEGIMATEAETTDSIERQIEAVEHIQEDLNNQRSNFRTVSFNIPPNVIKFSVRISSTLFVYLDSRPFLNNDQ